MPAEVLLAWLAPSPTETAADLPVEVAADSPWLAPVPLETPTEDPVVSEWFVLTPSEWDRPAFDPVVVPALSEVPADWFCAQDSFADAPPPPESEVCWLVWAESVCERPTPVPPWPEEPTLVASLCAPEAPTPTGSADRLRLVPRVPVPVSLRDADAEAFVASLAPPVVPALLPRE